MRISEKNVRSSRGTLIVNIPPSVALAIFVKNLKGSSSRLVHTQFGIAFAWQGRYSAFTISERNLDQAIQYVANQKNHHQHGTIYRILEECPND